MKRDRAENYKTITMEIPYGKSIIFRKSHMSKKNWEYVCYKCGLMQYDPEKIVAIKIDGYDEYHNAVVTATVERQFRDDWNDLIDGEEE